MTCGQTHQGFETLTRAKPGDDWITPRVAFQHQAGAAVQPRASSSLTAWNGDLLVQR
jgi:hypothetical protein